MRLGFLGSYGSAAQTVRLAVAAEEAGWDGFFTWDGVSLTGSSGWDVAAEAGIDIWDPFVILGAVATQTSRLRLGALVFAPARRQPWQLAREVLTVDHLSGGRLVLPVGIGAAEDAAVSGVRGGPRTARERADALDEALGFLDRAWSGEVFSHAGEHFGIDDVQFLPRPVQRPRVPVWPVGVWPAPRSMRRAARWDGVLLQRRGSAGDAGPWRPQEVADAVAWLRDERARSRAEGAPVVEHVDVVLDGPLPADRREARALVEAYAEAGATWFVASDWEPASATPEAQLERVLSGPPR